MQPEHVQRLQDNLFELRCAAEDIATAASEGVDAGELREMCGELVTLARRIEKMR